MTETKRNRNHTTQKKCEIKKTGGIKTMNNHQPSPRARWNHSEFWHKRNKRLQLCLGSMVIARLTKLRKNEIKWKSHWIYERDCLHFHGFMRRRKKKIWKIKLCWKLCWVNGTKEIELKQPKAKRGERI